MSMSLDAAAEVFRQAVRDSVRRYAVLYLIQGVLLVAAGILAILFPVVSSLTVVVLLGWLLIISGLVQALSLVGTRHVPHFWLQLVSVIVGVAIGILLLRNPGEGVLSIGLFLIVFFMMEGVSRIVFSLTIRPLRNWIWVMLSGLLAVALSVIMWVNLPLTAVWLVGLLLGTNLISNGAALAWLAWSVRQEQ